MAFRTPTSTFSFFLLICSALALQVAPDSPCAAICLDNGNKDVTSPISSNTFSTDVVCKDNEYTDLEEGRKYKVCMRCLQGSGATQSGENDQAWFIYNLRFAVSSCLFDWSNSTSDTCSTESSCGPLQSALQEGSLDPSRPTWSYCSADENTFLSSDLETCIGCLRSTENVRFLANFLVALQAGCIQRPGSQVLIGVDGDIFSSTPAKMANHGESAISSNEPRKGLSQGAIVGIAVGLGVPAIIGIAVLIFFCVRNDWHKRASRAKMSRLGSPLDHRFGSKSITSPNVAAYGNPYANPPIEVKEMMPSTLSPKEKSYVDGTKLKSILKSKTAPEKPSKLNTKIHKHTRNSPSYPPTSAISTVPAHQAYIPAEVSPISTTSTLAPLPLPSTNHNISQTSAPTTQPSESSQTRRHLQEASIRKYTPQRQEIAPSEPSPPTFRSRSQSQTRARSRSRSGSRSRSKGPTRSGSAAAAPSNRATTLMGVGNSNASQEHPIRSRISASMIHFDFDLAEKDRVRRAGDVSAHPDDLERGGEEVSPAASEGDGEQWPGRY